MTWLIRMSMSIPFVYNHVAWQPEWGTYLGDDISGHDIVDGGLGSNFGIEMVMATSEIICFLDDDTLLMPNYFEEIIRTYQIYPDALGVGGYINNDDPWFSCDSSYKPNAHHFCFDGYYKSDGSRFVLRKKLNLDSDKPPGFLPEFSHGRSISFLPPSGKIYEVEQFMGGVSSFRKKIFETL